MKNPFRYFNSSPEVIRLEPSNSDVWIGVSRNPGLGFL